MDFDDYLTKLDSTSCPADMLILHIIDDMGGRSGFGNALDEADADTLIEMFDGWRAQTREVMGL